MFRRTRIAMLAVVAIIAAHTATAVEPSAFKKHVIDGDFAGGYQVTVADIDKDGKPDIVALSTTPAQLVWYKNPSWQRYTATSKTKDNIDVAAEDIDRDGDTDLALAYEFSLEHSGAGGKLAWLECPADPTQSGDWALHPIGAVPTSHRVRWATLDRGAGPERYLVNLPIVGTGAKAPLYKGGAQLLAYRPTKSGAGNAQPWAATVIDATLEMAHGMRIVQWDDDAPDEVLTASFGGVHLFDVDPTTHEFTKRQIGKGHSGTRPAQGSSEVAFGTVRSQEMKFVATIEPWHGNEVVVYELGTPTTMGEERVVIDSALKDGHALALLDVENDGNDEIVAGGRGGDMALRIYQFEAETAEWAVCKLDKGNIAAAGAVAADIDQDGRQDIVAIGTSTHNVVWYENVLTY